MVPAGTRCHPRRGQALSEGKPGGASKASVAFARPPWPIEPERALARLTLRVLEGTMSERRITQLFGLILGGIFTFSLVLSAFAY